MIRIGCVFICFTVNDSIPAVQRNIQFLKPLLFWVGIINYTHSRRFCDLSPKIVVSSQKDRSSRKSTPQRRVRTTKMMIDEVITIEVIRYTLYQIRYQTCGHSKALSESGRCELIDEE
jgi:hypothetical protein